MTDQINRLKEDVADFFGSLGEPGFGMEGNLFLTTGPKLAQFADISSGHHVLDVAAGRGANLFPAASLAGKEGKVLGVDLAHQMVQKTTQAIETRGIENAQVVHMDVENLELDDLSFDRVLCGFAVFFFPQLDRALDEIKRVLKPGGIFAVSSLHDKDLPWVWYEKLLQSYGITTRFQDMISLCSDNLYTPADLEKMLHGAGFENPQVRVEVCDDIYQDEQDWWDQLQSSTDGKLFHGLDAQTLERFKNDAFARLGTMRFDGGIRGRWEAILAKGKKPL